MPAAIIEELAANARASRAYLLDQLVSARRERDELEQENEELIVKSLAAMEALQL